MANTLLMFSQSFLVLFFAFRSETNNQLHNLHLKWQKQSQLLQDSDFAFQEPIMALRTVILKILLEKENENDQRECIENILTEHLVELSRLARMANNSQVRINRKLFPEIEAYTFINMQILDE